MQPAGRSITEENECEVAVQERFKPAKSGTWVRVTTIEGDPARVNEAISDYKAKAVPTVQKQPGARAAILLVDRKAGKSFSGTIWDTEKDLQNSEAAVAGIPQGYRRQGGPRGSEGRGLRGPLYGDSGRGRHALMQSGSGTCWVPEPKLAEAKQHLDLRGEHMFVKMLQACRSRWCWIDFSFRMSSAAI